MTRYTGYLDGSRADPLATKRGDAIRDEHGLGDGAVHVCLAGGGDDGARLAGTFAEAPLPDGSTGVVLTGPFMAPERVADLDAVARRRDDLRVVRVLPGADTLIWMADRVVAMGGYHTTSEALAAGRRALIVPSTRSRPDQLIRARRLENLGAADVLPAAELNPRALAAWIASDARPMAPITGVIDTDGLSRLPALLDELASPVEVGPRRRTTDQRFRRRLAAFEPELAAVSAAG
jgi:predicted glycosyltransferase